MHRATSQIWDFESNSRLEKISKFEALTFFFFLFFFLNKVLALFFKQYSPNEFRTHNLILHSVLIRKGGSFCTRAHWQDSHFFKRKKKVMITRNNNNLIKRFTLSKSKIMSIYIYIYIFFFFFFFFWKENTKYFFFIGNRIFIDKKRTMSLW